MREPFFSRSGSGLIKVAPLGFEVGELSGWEQQDLYQRNVVSIEGSRAPLSFADSHILGHTQAGFEVLW